MKLLKEGMQGPEVEKWQLFLIGQGYEIGNADKKFGPKTKARTMEFQRHQGLIADGVVGNRTYAKAANLGFMLLDEPGFDELGPNWPPPPAFPPLVSTSQRQALFGKFAYKAQPLPDNKENIVITNDWESKNIIWVDIPQMRHLLPSGRMQFHKSGAAALRNLFKDWEKANLHHLIFTFGGSYVPRFVRGSDKVLSNHAFGTAFDINMQWNPLGADPAHKSEKGTVRELVDLANKNGFFWGGHFKKRPDGMHFELAKL